MHTACVPDIYKNPLLYRLSQWDLVQACYLIPSKMALACLRWAVYFPESHVLTRVEAAFSWPAYISHWSSSWLSFLGWFGPLYWLSLSTDLLHAHSRVKEAADGQSCMSTCNLSHRAYSGANYNPVEGRTIYLRYHFKFCSLREYTC